MRGGPSLNEILMRSPKLQPDLFDILVNFPLHPVAFAGDIEKMYRKVWIHEEDRCLQKILWRPSLKLPMKEYELCTVTYSTVPASFQAQKCLELVADKIASTEPKAAEVIKTNFYMDNFLKLVPTVEEACHLRSVVHEALGKAHFCLCKYVSNLKELLSTINCEDVAVSPAELLPETCVSVLGLTWEPERDEFCVKLNAPVAVEKRVTKRLILSFTARIFDPLGFLAPFVV